MSDTNGSVTLKGLTSDKVAELMANSRQRNAYGPKLIEFCESDEAAVNPSETWPVEFAGKKASTMYQGFRNAAEKAGLQDTILIKLSDDAVYILHKGRVSVLMQPAEENGNGS